MALLNGDDFWRELKRLVQTSQHQQAILLFRRLRTHVEQDVQAMKSIGDDLYRRGDLREALSSYEWVLLRQPNNNAALYNAAVCNKRLDQMDAAASLLERLLDLAPDRAGAREMLGEVRFANGEFDQALREFEIALAKTPEDGLLAYRHQKAQLAAKGGLGDLAAVFSDIYTHKVWGGSAARPHRFYSGEGSHERRFVQPYVEAVNAFLSGLPWKPHVVDIGCGDFNIGSRIRPACGRYTAVDVVPDLIAYNAERFAELDVEFTTLDVTKEAPPVADVFCIREVFQHLSNDQISKALANIQGRYSYLILTESIPKGHFPPNRDKPSGENVRMQLNGSGVVLTEPPFNLAVRAEKSICAVERDSTIVLTRVYTALGPTEAASPDRRFT